MFVKPFIEDDIEAVCKFTDTQIGTGYYKIDELKQIQKRSIDPRTGLICSFVLYDEKSDTIKGLRLAYPPGNWEHGKGNKIRPDLWPHPIEKTAYFQSLFLSADVQGEGWGPRLSDYTVQVFKNLGAQGIVTHSWKESPNNSSFRYLQKIGFKTIIEHPLYWIDVDYVCARDGKPCRCTAIEMYRDLVNETSSEESVK